jgi:hypothetical protein
MKTTIRSIVALAAIGFALAACGGQAQAQTFPELFNAGPSTFSTVQLRSFECVANAIVLTDQNGAVSPAADFPDAGGATCAKLKASADVQRYYYQSPGTNLFINTRQIYRSFCNYGNTMIIWNSGGNQRYNDACGLASNIAARAQ